MLHVCVLCHETYHVTHFIFAQASVLLCECDSLEQIEHATVTTCLLYASGVIKFRSSKLLSHDKVSERQLHILLLEGIQMYDKIEAVDFHLVSVNFWHYLCGKDWMLHFPVSVKLSFRFDYIDDRCECIS